ncbi:MAG: DUF2807 domain-containing protein [Firmicutes bacterium]|jgi:hypothetical protein|nr:DUF2807 domain-containing protein [Bacillota bacterium]
MKVIKLLLVVLLVSSIFLGCSGKNTVEVNAKENSVSSSTDSPVESDDIITKSYDLHDFKSFDVSNSIKVKISKSDTYSVKVTTSQDVFDILDIRVDEETFIAGFKPNMQLNNEEVFIEITCMDVKDINIVNSATIRIDTPFEMNEENKIKVVNSAYLNGNLSGKSIEMEAVNSGKIKLSGSFDNVDAKATNSASIDLTNLTIKNAKATLANSANITIGVEEEIKIKANNSSSITLLKGKIVEQSVDDGSNLIIK